MLTSLREPRSFVYRKHVIRHLSTNLRVTEMLISSASK